MQLSSTLSWLIDAAGEAPDADWLLAELGRVWSRMACRSRAAP